MTLYVCPWCDEVGYDDDDEDFEDDDGDDSEGDGVMFEICVDCLFDFQWYFVLDDIEIFEFLRELDMYAPWPDSLVSDFCEAN
jgi:hypothetical protein